MPGLEFASGSGACIIFLHIPKTGGVTLRATLRHKYSETLRVHSPHNMAKVENVPLDERRTARVVTGHLLYGVHQYIPQECEYITLLREPVARALSNYYRIRENPHHWFHEQVRSGMGLEDFVRDPAGPADNLQTRLISGRRWGDMISRGSDGHLKPTRLGSETLEEAKQNLERFLVVGLTERFDESVILVRRALGWKLPMYAIRNATKSRPDEPPAPEVVELIRERDQLDVELYGYACDLFSAAVSRHGPSFRRELAAFKALNRIPNKVGPLIPAPLRRSLASMLPR
jgi:hypothetical protein